MKLAALAALAALSLSLSIAATGAQAQPKPANQISRQDIQAAMDRELHVIDASTVVLCSARHPALAKDIDKLWQQNLASLSPDLIAYRKTDAFAKAMATYQQEQAAEARKPENQKTLQALCRSMAGQ